MAQDDCRCRFGVPTLDTGVHAWRDQYRRLAVTEVVEPEWFTGCGPNGRI